MFRRLALAALVVLVVGLALGAGVASPTRGLGPEADTVGRSIANPESMQAINSSNASIRPDPSEDRIGWEGGIWYNESLDVSYPLSQDEIRRITRRAAARVEYLRGLEYQSLPSVTLISRETFIDEYAPARRDVSDSERALRNAMWEAMYVVDESQDAIAVQRRNRREAVLGFYNHSREEIVIVSDSASAPRMNEVTLAQELMHALQYQQFSLPHASPTTLEGRNSHQAVIEGDANYVEILYQRRCRAETWGSCIQSRNRTAVRPRPEVNDGVALARGHPYKDGPKFIQQRRSAGGWDSIDALYEHPPESTEQVIHPTKYQHDVPTAVVIPDRSSERWHRVTIDGRPDYEVVGEAGLSTMFMYPTYESHGTDGLVAPNRILNANERGTASLIDPVNYSLNWSSGWDGDRLYVYTPANGTPPETAYVWKLAWDSRAEAAEFQRGYTRLLAYNGATRRTDDTWVLPESSSGDAVRIKRHGDRVIIVNAPTVEALTAIHHTEAPAGTGSVTATPAQTVGTTRSQSGPLEPLSLRVSVASVALGVVLLWRYRSTIQ
ncbi:MAG: Hvo_1808 family surface protein [Halorhabdus sp.]